jgi:hypothetical protein
MSYPGLVLDTSENCLIFSNILNYYKVDHNYTQYIIPIFCKAIPRIGSAE